jgi:hypothetical protein
MNHVKYFAVFALLLSGCSYTTYNMNKGKLKLTSQSNYPVTYQTIIPQGANATIWYTAVGGTEQKLEHVTGSWAKTVDLPSGQPVLLKINTRLPKADTANKLNTIIKVGNEIVSQQIQTGTNVRYQFAFQLP